MKFDLENLSKAKITKKLRLVSEKFDELLRIKATVDAQLAELKGQYNLLNELLGGNAKDILASKPDAEELALDKDDEVKKTPEPKGSDKKSV